jgi:hypothetical protein
MSSNDFFFVAGPPVVGGTLDDAIRENEFYQLSITPKTGASLSLASFDLNYRRSGNGPTGGQLQYSLDGFSTAGTAISDLAFSGSDTNGVKQPTINLSGVSSLQNINDSTVTFRLYLFGATTASGTGAIGRLAGDDLALDGTVVSSVVDVPEPTSVALVGVAGLLLAARRRKTV